MCKWKIHTKICQSFKRLFLFQSSSYWHYTVQLIIFLHICLVFWRPLTNAQLEKMSAEVLIIKEVLYLWNLLIYF